MNRRADLLPGTAKAQKIHRIIRENIDLSHNHIAQMFPLWDELEMSYRAWRPTDDQDRESLKMHGVKKIIIPIQFATIQTMLTFLMEIYTALKPVLRVRGTDPSTMKKSRVMEVALDYDYRGNRGYFMLQQWFFNMCRYGYSPMRNTWGTKSVIRQVYTPGPPSLFTAGGQEYRVPGPAQLTRDTFTVFEGNKWEVIDNRNWFPDPRWPLARFQEGVFCAERDMIHDHDLYEMDRADLFFNIDAVKDSGNRASDGTGIFPTDHRRDRYQSRTSLEVSLTEAKKNRMHLNESIVMRVIPRDLELSTDDRPQDWLFNLVDDYAICRAEPSPFLPRFPYGIIESYPDVLAFIGQGVMELTQPLAAHLSFLFNSHMQNVRKAVNDRFLADPSRINIDDFLDPDNSIVRLLPGAYGTNPADALQQLAVVDITKQHFGDAQQLMDFWKTIMGTSEHMFGQISEGRRTAFELQGVFRQAGARMKMMADLMSSEGVAPLTEMMAITRQENMTMEQFMEVAGQTAVDLGVDPSEIVDGFLKVRKDHLTGVFHYPAEEGVLPQNRTAMAEMLQKTLDMVAQNPFLAQVFDPVQIFREMIRQGGMHNIDDFLRQGLRAEVAIMTPDQIAQLYSKGDIVPANVEGNTPGRKNEGVVEDRETLTMAGAINGAGASYRG